MPNNYFKFKQFTAHQDKCAMKVCTDACLFGAWIANRLLFTANRGLDIGCGTGLLSLMLAQKLNDVNIDAVEIDEAAAQQANENFEASPWKDRLHIQNISIQQFVETVTYKYDVIISNPPFYESDLKSDDAKRNLALHSSELKLEELISIADKLLNDGGNFFILMPYYRTNEFERLIKGKFCTKEKVYVKQTERHNYFRSMFCLSRQTYSTTQSEMIIMNKDGGYTNEFAALLRDYYLYL